MNVGERIKLRRKELKISADTLAERVGVYKRRKNHERRRKN
nr:MAG TPA: transcription factor [Caudoviricetes sp.]DAT21977.1 MAG TPA: Microphthalmia-associated transcription factor [Caudoviricetes sp.]